MALILFASIKALIIDLIPSKEYILTVSLTCYDKKSPDFPPGEFTEPLAISIDFSWLITSC